MTFRVCLAAGGHPRKVIEIREDETMENLYDKATECFGSECSDLRSGFPPKSLEKSAAIKVQVVIPNNEKVTVTLVAVAAASKKSPVARKKKKSSEAAGTATGRRPKRAAAQAATASFSEVIKAQDEMMKDQSPNVKRKSAGSSSVPRARKRNNAAASIAASRKMAKLPGRRLVDGASVGPSPSHQNKKKGAKFNSKDDVSFALLNALESGGGGKVGSVLRGAMKNAITRQYDASRAVTRVSAVQAGKFTITDNSEVGSSLTVSYDKGLEGRGEIEETVDYIPRDALEAVITAIHRSDNESLRGTTLAQLSPRVFWSLLKETGCRSIEEALIALLPDLDWTFLRRRRQALSEKAKENLRQEKMANGEENVVDTAKAEEAVQAVEDAMDQLNQYDRSQRRNRAAQAATSRSQDEWQMTTPTDVDEDELLECTGSSTMVSQLIEIGIRNWRQLALIDPHELAGKLDIEDYKDTEPWIDRAQQESIDEIVVEVCDNRIEAVEALRDEARTGTLKDLANWRSISSMLFQSAPSLRELGVSVEDVTKWCARSHELVEEHEWMSWYATPVE